MDPIHSINYKKDSTLAMLFEAQARDYEIYYMEQTDLYIDGESTKARAKQLQVIKNPDKWFEFKGESDIELASLDVILMRKDPPFDMDYIYTTYSIAAICLITNWVIFI